MYQDETILTFFFPNSSNVEYSSYTSYGKYSGGSGNPKVLKFNNDEIHTWTDVSGHYKCGYTSDTISLAADKSLSSEYPYCDIGTSYLSCNFTPGHKVIKQFYFDANNNVHNYYGYIKSLALVSSNGLSVVLNKDTSGIILTNVPWDATITVYPEFYLYGGSKFLTGTLEEYQDLVNNGEAMYINCLSGDEMGYNNPNWSKTEHYSFNL